MGITLHSFVRMWIALDKWMKRITIYLREKNLFSFIVRLCAFWQDTLLWPSLKLCAKSSVIVVSKFNKNINDAVRCPTAVWRFFVLPQFDISYYLSLDWRTANCNLLICKSRTVFRWCLWIFFSEKPFFLHFTKLVISLLHSQTFFFCLLAAFCCSVWFLFSCGMDVKSHLS